MVVQNEPCQWNTPIFRPRGSRTTEPIDIKFDRCDYVGDITHMLTLVFLSPRGAVVHMRKFVIIRVYFLHHVTFLIPCASLEVAPFDGFRVLWLKRRASAIVRSLWGENKNFNNFHYFRKKTQNSLFPQCKILIGNNSGSIKDRVVRFAYSRGFSAIADRMV